MILKDYQHVFAAFDVLLFTILLISRMIFILKHFFFLRFLKIFFPSQDIFILPLQAFFYCILDELLVDVCTRRSSSLKKQGATGERGERASHHVVCCVDEEASGRQRREMNDSTATVVKMSSMQSEDEYLSPG